MSQSLHSEIKSQDSSALQITLLGLYCNTDWMTVHYALFNTAEKSFPRNGFIFFWKSLAWAFFHLRQNNNRAVNAVEIRDHHREMCLLILKLLSSMLNIYLQLNHTLLPTLKYYKFKPSNIMFGIQILIITGIANYIGNYEKF